MSFLGMGFALRDKRPPKFEKMECRQMQEKGKFAKGFFTGVAVTLVIVLSVWSVKSLLFELLPGLGNMNASAVQDRETVNRKLGQIQELIDDYYLYGDEIDEDALIEGIYSGYASGLGDPYTEYYDAQEAKELMATTSGEFFGIGATMMQDPQTYAVEVVSVYQNSPAQEAGLEAGDVIYQVDDHVVTDESLDEVVSWIKGDEGTEVVLHVRRDGEELELTAVRGKIEVQTVEYEMKEEQIGYIAVSEFDDVTYKQFQTALEDLEEQGMKGLVIDLRNNPGGNLDTVTDMLKLILPEGTIVSTRDKYGDESTIKCDGKHEFTKPLALLVNQYSASASEIFAGAVQDYGVGEIVGETTYGKGVVQQIIDLQDGTYLKLTVAEYYTPSGRSINGTGVKPDVEVEYEPDVDDPNADNQLERAMEVVEEKLD